jgi:GH15 family glucan-1,4-alpha-glucosidase
MTTTAPLTDTDLRALAAKSLRVILSQQQPGGAYPASPDFSAYAGYSWFRDGSFIADAASAAGAIDSASAFHDWCASIVVARAERIREIVERASTDDPAPDEFMLATRYTFDGREGADEWWDFQLDGYGTWLWALGAHVERHGLDPARWAGAVELCTAYLSSSWERPCFDWWEEHRDQVHVSTLGCVAAGLRAAVRLGTLTDGVRDAAASADSEISHVLGTDAIHDGHLSKWLGAHGVDGSLSALVGVMGVVDPRSATARATIAAVERDLVRDGGTFRYLGDTFFGGGQWPLLSCMLGQAHLAAGDPVRARELLVWAAATADERGTLPEQVDLHLNDPSFVTQWIERWGPVARPLLWSHAMFLRLALDLGLVTPSDLAHDPDLAQDPA